MKLILEDIVDIQYIAEGEGKKDLFVVGPYLQGGVPNRNRRFYPPDLLEREVSRYTKEYIDTNRAVGELSHPQSPTVNLDRISHKILSLKREGDNWIGKSKILDTPCGKIARALINDGVVIGMSSRGLGSLKEDKKMGAHVVQDDYRLCVGADLVADPSAPDAFVRGVLEDVEWVYDAARGTWAQKEIEQVAEEMKGMSTKELNEKKLGLFSVFLDQVSTKDLSEESLAHIAYQAGISTKEVNSRYVQARKAAARYGHAGSYTRSFGILKRMLGLPEK